MKVILAISGSGRDASTNTAMLRAVSLIARSDHDMTVFAGLVSLPIFSPDLVARPLPAAIQSFADLIRQSDGLIISSPEYVRSIPGGLKNAIDWLVSGDELTNKPVALMHASHRGDDMLAQLRLVLSTVSQRFADDVFLRFEFLKLSPQEVSAQLATRQNRALLTDFLNRFARHCL